MSKLHESGDRPALVRVDIDQLVAALSDPPPDPYEARASEQVPLDRHPVEAPHVVRSIDPLRVQACRTDFNLGVAVRHEEPRTNRGTQYRGVLLRTSASYRALLIFFRCCIPLDAGDRRGLCHPHLLHQPRQQLESLPIGLVIKRGLGAQALQHAAAGVVLGQFRDRDACLDAPSVRLAQNELVDANVPRRGHGHFLGCFGHQILSTTGAGSHACGLAAPHTQINHSHALACSRAAYLGERCPRTIILRGSYQTVNQAPRIEGCTAFSACDGPEVCAQPLNFVL